MVRNIYQSQITTDSVLIFIHNETGVIDNNVGI